MEGRDKITAMEKALDFLVSEVRKIGFFVERIDYNVQKMLKLLHGKIDRGELEGKSTDGKGGARAF
jgi:hypothetical protein